MATKWSAGRKRGRDDDVVVVVVVGCCWASVFQQHFENVASAATCKEAAGVPLGLRGARLGASFSGKKNNN